MENIQPINLNQANPGNLGVGGIDSIGGSRTGRVQPNNQAFKEILEAKLNNEIKFSGHALARLQRREIQLDDVKLSRLKEGIDLADKKGSRSSLVLMDDLAMIVSVKNKTVITAMDGKNIKENVFTNIDSAVIV